MVLIPLVLLAGAVGGGVWGAIPGAFKAYFAVNEILSTIMLNLVAVQLMNYLLAGPLVDHTSSVGGLIPQTRLLSSHSWLPILAHGTQLHLGVPIAVAVAVAVYVLLWRTSFGFRIRAVGLSREAATYAGIPVARTTTLALTLSGAMCGLAGAMLVFGSDLAPDGHRRVASPGSPGRRASTASSSRCSAASTRSGRSSRRSSSPASWSAATPCRSPRTSPPT